MKILPLTLTELPFKTMLKGLKDREYRRNTPSKWIKYRLIDSKTGKPKKIDYIKFSHGYGSGKPYFICKCLGFEMAKKNYTVKYSTGLVVNVRKGNFRILLGKVVRTGNMGEKELF